MSLEAGAVVGFFLGFAFGVGCALAVMYSIYMGGYRAAVRDSRLSEPPERWVRAVAKLPGDTAGGGSQPTEPGDRRES